MTIFQRIDSNRALVMCLLSSPLLVTDYVDSFQYQVLLYWNKKLKRGRCGRVPSILILKPSLGLLFSFRRITVWRKFHPYTICNKLSCHWLKDWQKVGISVVPFFDSTLERNKKSSAYKQVHCAIYYSRVFQKIVCSTRYIQSDTYESPEIKVSIFITGILEEILIGKVEHQRARELTKGQLISKCPFGVIVWAKIPTKFFPRFLP